MTEQNQKQLGNTLCSIADQLRGAMDADDFRAEVPFSFAHRIP
jgi:type I restriction enzyme M protein